MDLERKWYNMDVKQILTMCDHTLLKQEATWEQIKTICDDGKAYD